MHRSRVYPDVLSALDGQFPDGVTITSGGFDLPGNPQHPMPAIKTAGVKYLAVFSDSCTSRLSEPAFDVMVTEVRPKMCANDAEALRSGP